MNTTQGSPVAHDDDGQSITEQDLVYSDLTAHARECIAVAENAVCQIEINLTRRTMTGMPTSDVEITLETANETLRRFQERLRSLEERYPLK